MSKTISQALDPNSEIRQETILGPKRGKITQLFDSGEVWVTFSGDGEIPVLAQFIIPLEKIILAFEKDQDVFLQFEDHSSQKPVITGVYFSILDQIVQKEITKVSIPAAFNTSEAIKITDENETVHLRVEKKMIIECGEASIMLCPDGEIILKGNKILSYSTGHNLIKGASICIN